MEGFGTDANAGRRARSTRAAPDEAVERAAPDEAVERAAPDEAVVSARAAEAGLRRDARNPAYKRYHPRWHRERTPITWWLRGRAYVLFIARELTSVAVGYAGLLILALVWSIARGPAAYQGMLDFLARPGVLVFHAFVFLALLFHTITWLNLTPQAMPRRVAGRRLAPGTVLAAHYIAWLVASVLIVWLLVWRA